MNMKIKEEIGAYSAPELNETSVSVEQGFATSGEFNIDSFEDGEQF